MYYLQPTEFATENNVAFSLTEATDNKEAHSTLEKNERNIAAARQLVKICRAECQQWAQKALADMLKKSAASGADYVSAMARFLDLATAEKGRAFPETYKAFMKLMPVVDSAFVEDRDSKGRARLTAIAGRTVPLNAATARILAMALDRAEVIKIEPSYLKDWKSGALSLVNFANGAEIQLVDQQTLDKIAAEKAAKAAKKEQARKQREKRALAAAAKKETENAKKAETEKTAAEKTMKKTA